MQYHGICFLMIALVGSPGQLCIAAEQTAPLHAATSDKLEGTRNDEKTIVNSIGMTLKLIPPGAFIMGSPEDEPGRHMPYLYIPNRSDEPHHRVHITKPFYVGIHEVTQGEYEQVMAANPSYFSQAGGSEEVLGLDTRSFPVERVSWNDAIEFCQRLSKREGRGYRLPTEAEWEYACRAGTKTVFAFGDTLSHEPDANFGGDVEYGYYGTIEADPHLRRTASVGSYRPNAWGLYDMHGNVSEWCQDRYWNDYYLSGPMEDPKNLEKGENRRVIRGGAYYSPPRNSRSAARGSLKPDSRDNWVGFRIVLEPES